MRIRQSDKTKQNKNKNKNKNKTKQKQKTLAFEYEFSLQSTFSVELYYVTRKDLTITLKEWVGMTSQSASFKSNKSKTVLPNYFQEP